MGIADIVAGLVIVAFAALGFKGRFKGLHGILTGVLIGCVVLGIAGLVMLAGPWSESTAPVVKGSAVLAYLANKLERITTALLVSQ